MRLTCLRPGTYFADVGVKLVADKVQGDRSYSIFQNGRFVGYEYSLADVRSLFKRLASEVIANGQ